MEAIAYEVNVTTGETVERPRTADELAAEAAEQAIWAAKAAEAAAAAEDAAAKKAATLAALAAAAGLDPDDVAQALGV